MATAAPPAVDAAAEAFLVASPKISSDISGLRQRKPLSSTESDAYRADDEAGDDGKSKVAEEVTWGKTPSGTGEFCLSRPRTCCFLLIV